MTDYGQDLQFGTFLTPDAATPDRVVELALLTEAAGLDLATVQDHPYQRRFLDAWALLATILARTSSLRVTTNVANLPLRPPHVLATTVASLDLLSRGRVELGIGAGAFWDAIVAAGGPRRTPGEALRALDDGIAVIRKTWAAGPAPAHDVEIWIGAIGPGCSSSPDASVTAGCPASPTCRSTPSPSATPGSTTPRSPPAAIRQRSAVSTTSLPRRTRHGTSSSPGSRSPTG